eukprot:14428415-Ditylum_brightwellii.AAC.1
MVDTNKRAAKSIKLPTISRDKKSFQIWWMRFKACEIVYGFVQSIKQEADPNLPTRENEIIANTDTNAAAKRKSVKMNVIEMCNLAMAFTTESLKGLIYASMTNEWLSGLTCLVVVSLQGKYAPPDMVSKIEPRRELNDITMKEEDDPATIFKKISGLENRFNTAIFKMTTEANSGLICRDRAFFAPRTH